MTADRRVDVKQLTSNLSSVHLSAKIDNDEYGATITFSRATSLHELIAADRFSIRTASTLSEYGFEKVSYVVAAKNQILLCRNKIMRVKQNGGTVGTFKLLDYLST